MKAAILHKPLTRVSVEDVDIEYPHRERYFWILWERAFVTATITWWTGTSCHAHSPGLWDTRARGSSVKSAPA